jgi:hypothetical protein
LGLLALLLVLFGLATAGGYLLQRTVFRGNDEQTNEAATAQPVPQPADETTRESGPSEPPPPVASDANTPAASPSESPEETRKQSASSGAAAPQAATPQSNVAASPAGQASKTTPAVKQSASTAGTIPAPAAAEQPRPEPPRKPAPQAANAFETAVAGGIAQVRPSSPAETTIAAATNEAAANETATNEAAATSETAATRPRTPRNEVFRPDAQSPPRPAASQNQSTSSAGGGAPSPAPAPQALEEGIIYWTGRLTKNQVIVIDRGKATIGMADGNLPATPVDVWLPSPAVTLVERPTSQNNWSRVAFRCLQSTNRNVTLNIQWKRLR